MHTLQRVIITGASGGIGAAIARRLAEEGVTLLLCGRNSQRLMTLQQLLPGNQHQLLQADLTTEQGLKDLQVAAAVFAADALINCLGINQLQLLQDSTASDAMALLLTNLLAPINICRELLPQLQAKPAATIVNVGSILGSIGYPGSSLYCATKFGLRGFTEALRRELADTQVRVLYFAPRATDTELNSEEMQELNQQLGNRTDSPEWVAQALWTALQQGPSNVYLGWPESLFVRINALLPGLVDKATLKQLPLIRYFCRHHLTKATGAPHEMS